MARVNQCCCCCSLRTGTLILLWLTVISAVLGFFTTPNMLNIIDDQLSTDNSLLGITLILHLVDHIIGLGTAIYGLNGIQRNIAKYLTPYLYCMYFEAALIALTTLIAVPHPIVYSIVMGVHSVTEIPFEFGFLIFTILLVAQIYFCVVVQSYRDSMRETAAADYSIRSPPYPNF